ncbi:MAG TPA: hypothetical protein VG318_09310 [Actinomycetota bacterium]|nr:hypothetical protein [Actinomycetota bacterium]
MKWFERLGTTGRAVATVVVVLGTIAWTAYLVTAESSGDDSGFGLLVRAMGSLGILYGLFLVLRPRSAGVLGFGAVGHEERRAPQDSWLDDGSNPRWGLVTLIIALAVGSIGYRITQHGYLHQTASFFVGIPAVMAITLAFTPRAKSATGTIVKGLTLALLLSGIVAGEGFVCILMAAPLFYLVGIVIGIPIDRARRRRHGESRVYSIAGVGMLLLSLEGVMPATTFPQIETVSVTRVVDASPAEVRAQLAATPRFDAELPLYLKLGFPRPRGAYGSGLAVGDTRTIVFGNESPMEPMTADGGHDHGAAAPGVPMLELEIVRSRRGRVVFQPVQDRTAFTHWIAWGRSVVEWSPADDGDTEVTWTLTYRRKLSPAWYFAPWQRYAARLATGYLVDTVATP